MYCAATVISLVLGDGAVGKYRRRREIDTYPAAKRSLVVTDDAIRNLGRAAIKVHVDPTAPIRHCRRRGERVVADGAIGDRGTVTILENNPAAIITLVVGDSAIGNRPRGARVMDPAAVPTTATIRNRKSVKGGAATYATGLDYPVGASGIQDGNGRSSAL